jgi:hypothetical protein
MSRTSRNFIIAYAVLVGLPIVGLVGILKSGRTLAAPISVDGVWKLQTDPVHLAALPCGKTLAISPEAALAISQSGRNFTLSLSDGPKSAASGVLDGTSLKASLVPSAPWSEEAGCGSGHEISLVATVDPKANPRSLEGTLSVDHCPPCAPVEFRAVRLATPVKKGSY